MGVAVQTIADGYAEAEQKAGHTAKARELSVGLPGIAGGGGR